MYRCLIKDLQAWKVSESRKPLILNGARQVGKTWILEEFGKTFTDGFIRIDFDRQKDIKQLFEKTKDPNELISYISFALGRKITTETLIIFDEIQECPEALNSLKYFYEDTPQYYIAAAGSLLGLSLAKGFPVGKVNLMHVSPLNFEEFLLARGQSNLVEFTNSINKIDNIPDIFLNRLNWYIKEYYSVGGMPEAVLSWVTHNEMQEVEKILAEINSDYERDFGKHAQASDIQKIKYIWDSIPSQLAKENRKFLYSAAKPGARAREYENALLWLVNAENLAKVSRITKPGIPVSAYEDLSAFKIYFNDIGLLREKAGLPVKTLFSDYEMFSEFKGAIAENFLFQELKAQNIEKIYYWTDANHEVDFIIQAEEKIIPVECKAGRNIRSTSLKYYLEKYKEVTSFGIRYSMNNLSFDGRILNIPLCLAGRTKDFINIVD